MGVPSFEIPVDHTVSPTGGRAYQESVAHPRCYELLAVAYLFRPKFDAFHRWVGNRSTNDIVDVLALKASLVFMFKCRFFERLMGDFIGARLNTPPVAFATFSKKVSYFSINFVSHAF